MNQQPEESIVSLILKRKSKFLEMEGRTSRVYNLVISDPYTNLSKINDLMESFDKKNEFPSIKKMIIKTLSDIFIDLLPGYKINTNEKEPSSKFSISKEVREIKKFEARFLELYSKFIKILSTHINDTSRAVKAEYNKEIDRTSPNYVILKSLLDAASRLLVSASHFNLSDEIFEIIINSCIHLHKYEHLCENIYQSIKTLFKTDKTYEGTLQIVKLIGNHCQINLNINAKLLDTLHHLNFDNFNLTTPENKKQLGDKRKFLSKKGKKDVKREAKDPNIDLELNETKEQMQKNRTSILTVVFTIYFQILKSSSKTPQILASCLKGLVLFSQLINIDFYDDLIKTLMNLIKNNNLSLNDNLNILYTIVKLPFFQDCFNIDYSFLYDTCYKIIPDIFNENDQTNNFNILIQSLKILLVTRSKEASTRRCMAFVKRIFNLMIHLDPSYCQKTFDLFKNIFIKFPSIKNLWDNQIDVIHSYLPSVDNSEYCNPEGILLWEIPLMNRHYESKLFEPSMSLIRSEKTDR